MSTQSYPVIETCDKSFNPKLAWSAVGAAIFVLISSSQMYAQTQKLVTTTSDNCPTMGGNLIHAAIFFGINFGVMKVASWNSDLSKPMSDKTMVRYALFSTLLFLILANSYVYNITNKVLPGLANEIGCPTSAGVIFHGVVFMVLLLIMMHNVK